MANRTRKSSGRKSAGTAVDTPGVENQALDAERGEEDRPSTGPGNPRWRQIEIMHERAQLRKMLDDLDMDFDELEMEVFGSEAEHDAFYRHLGEFEEQEDEIEGDGEEDDFEDDEFEDLES